MPRILTRDGGDARERRSPGRSLAAAASALQESLGMLIRPLVGVPYLVWFALQMALMGAYLSWNTGAAASIWARAVPGLAPETLRHYPEHLILMQPVLNRFEILLDIIVRCVFHGATIALIREVYRDRRPSLAGSFTEALRRYRDLLLVSFVSAAAVYAATAGGRFLSAGVGGTLRYAAAAAWIAAGLVVQAFFVYAIPFVVIGGRTFPGALSGGIVLTARLLTKTLCIVAIAFILTLPTLLLSLKAELIALRIAPEFMIHLHIATKVMELVSMYLITAGATVIFLKRTERRAGRDPAGGRSPGSDT